MLHALIKLILFTIVYNNEAVNASVNIFLLVCQLKQ